MDTFRTRREKAEALHIVNKAKTTAPSRALDSGKINIELFNYFWTLIDYGAFHSVKVLRDLVLGYLQEKIVVFPLIDTVPFTHVLLHVTRLDEDRRIKLTETVKLRLENDMYLSCRSAKMKLKLTALGTFDHFALFVSERHRVDTNTNRHILKFETQPARGFLGTHDTITDCDLMIVQKRAVDSNNSNDDGEHAEPLKNVVSKWKLVGQLASEQDLLFYEYGSDLVEMKRAEARAAAISSKGETAVRCEKKKTNKKRTRVEDSVESVPEENVKPLAEDEEETVSKAKRTAAPKKKRG